MATIGSGSPLLYVEGSAVQTGGSGNSRTVKITAKFRVNGNTSTAYHSWYGYPCNWRARVNNSYGNWTAIKGTETWYSSQGLRTFEQTLTVDVGTTSSKAITVGIYTDHPSYSYWNGSYTWSFTVGATNVAPVISGTITADGTTSNKTIPENQTTIALSAPAATDGNNNLSGYRFAVSVNGGGYTEIYKGANRTYNHTITGGEGTTYKYSCYAYDASGANSGTIYSPVLTKNAFTTDTLASSSSINFSSSSIGFTYSGAKNTNGNTTFTRTLSCDGLTVYNPSLGASPATVMIYKEGNAPTGCYVKFDDIKNKFKNSNYTGTLSFSLSVKNAYGTTKSSSKSISVDLRTNPNPVTGQQISTVTTESTIYKKVASSANYYFLPDGSGVARVKWSAGSGKLGEAISYELFVAYGSGSWQKVADIASGTNYYNHKISKQTVSQQFKYLIRTKTSYGYQADATTAAQTLHFYNAPGITVGTITRGATTADVKVTVKSNSSIPNINTVGSWLTVPATSSGNLTVAQTEQNIAVTGLTDAGTYTLKVTYNDNTGFASNVVRDIAIGQNSPLFFVNKFGVGVNGVKANSSYALNVSGDITASGSLSKPGKSTSWLDAAKGIGVAVNMTSKSGYNSIMRQKSDDGVWNFGTYQSSNAYYLTYMTDTNISAGTNTASTQFIFPSNGGGTVYTTGNKPTPAAIGALGNSGAQTLNTGGTSASDALTIAGSSKSGKLWAGTGGFVVQSNADTNLHLGNNNSTDMVFRASEIEVGKNINASGKNITVSKVNDMSISTGATGTTIVQRDANADISGRLMRANYQNETRMTGAVCFRVSTTDNYMRFCSDAGAFRGWLDAGSITTTAPRITNLNARLNSGWYSFTSGIQNAPSGVSYGVMLTMKWDSSTDFYQLLISSNNGRLYTRGYINGGYSPWAER